MSAPGTDSEVLAPGRTDAILLTLGVMLGVGASGFALVNDLGLAVVCIAGLLVVNLAVVSVVSLRLVQITKRQRHRRNQPRAVRAAAEGS